MFLALDIYTAGRTNCPQVNHDKIRIGIVNVLKQGTVIIDK